MLATTFEERAAATVLEKFNKLPRSSKPRNFPDGSREWTPISGIVLAKYRDSSDENLICVSVGTGSKCLPQNILPQCKGQVLHDCHAEILALRGLNYFLLAEIKYLLEASDQSADVTSTYVRHCPQDSQWSEFPFEIDPDVSIHMFSTEAPCGDASMEVLMAGKSAEDAVPWISAHDDSVLKGRGYFGDLGIVRRKPSRPDAPPTMSKSCTDKLTMRQITSLLSFPTCLFLAPSRNAYLSSLILPHERYSEIACNRAFGLSGRTQELNSQLAENKYLNRPFEITTIETPASELPYTRPLSGKVKIGNVSALWIAGLNGRGSSVNESLINGVKQGYKQMSNDTRRCSIISRLKMLELALQIATSSKESTPSAIRHLNTSNRITYQECKRTVMGMACPERHYTKQKVGEVLRGWPANSGDDDWEVSMVS